MHANNHVLSPVLQHSLAKSFAEMAVEQSKGIEEWSDLANADADADADGLEFLDKHYEANVNHEKIERHQFSRSTLAELVAQCDLNAPMPQDLIDWQNMPATGNELVDKATTDENCASI